jgi:acetylglutamate/LysW-gamma-L-alpha-aminoadipate kinase
MATDDITVVKCGGGSAVVPDRVCADLARRRALGERLVLVHGGGPAIDQLAAELGVPRRTLLAPSGLESSYTDPAALDVMIMTMAGRVKPRLLATLAGAGVCAAGLTGLDGGLLTARRKTARRAVIDGRTVLVRDDHSGTIVAVNPLILRVLLDAGITPVVSPPAASDGDGPLNVDADRAAAAIAVALGASRLLLLTAAPGLLRDPPDESTVLARCVLPAAGAAPRHAASAGMFRKLTAAAEALRGGVPAVRISDGRTDAPITAAIGGAGTALALGQQERA